MHVSNRKKVHWIRASNLHPNGFKFTHPHQVNVPWLTPEYPPEYHPLENFLQSE